MKYLFLLWLVPAVYAVQIEAPRPTQDENHQEHIKDFEKSKEDLNKKQLDKNKPKKSLPEKDSKELEKN